VNDSDAWSFGSIRQAILEVDEVREKRMGGGLCQDWAAWLGPA
jgi:hypothetical protein